MAVNLVSLPPAPDAGYFQRPRRDVSVSHELDLLRRRMDMEQSERSRDRQLELLALLLSGERAEASQGLAEERLGEERHQFGEQLAESSRQFNEQLRETAKQIRDQIAASQTQLETRIVAEEKSLETQLDESRIDRRLEEFGRTVQNEFSILGEAAKITGNNAPHVVDTLKRDMDSEIATRYTPFVTRTALIAQRSIDQNEIGDQLQDIEDQVNGITRALRDGSQQGSIEQRVAAVAAGAQALPEMISTLTTLKSVAGRSEKKRIDEMLKQLRGDSDKFIVNGPAVIAEFDRGLSAFVTDAAKLQARRRFGMMSELVSETATARESIAAGGQVPADFGISHRLSEINPNEFSRDELLSKLAESINGSLSPFNPPAAKASATTSGVPVADANARDDNELPLSQVFEEEGLVGLLPTAAFRGGRAAIDSFADAPPIAGPVVGAVSNTFVGRGRRPTQEDRIEDQLRILESQNRRSVDPNQPVNIIRPDGSVVTVLRKTLTPERVRELIEQGFRVPGFEGGGGASF